MKYKIIIEELISQEFEVSANTENEAYEAAKENYYNENFVLTPGEVHNRKVGIANPENESEIKWLNF